MTKLFSWNIAYRHKAWRSLVGVDADVALLQEARIPPEDVSEWVEVDPAPFYEAEGKGISRCAIVKLSEGIEIEWLEPVPISRAKYGDLIESQPGCLAAAIITPPGGRPFTAVSFCPEYEKPHRSTGKMSWNIVDASIHRVISDISLLIGRQRDHRIIAAGDLTIYHGYGEDKSGYWKGRYDTVFNRMAAIGLPFVGPQYPNGRQADPWPPELPTDSKNVPTYIHSTQTLETATSQLDYVFVSESMADSVKVRALNSPDEWGPSDHCRIEIEVA